MVLEVRNLTKTFVSGRRFFFWGEKQHPHTAVNQISFHLKPGEILGILGPNGAGKTTTIQMLLSTLKPTAGTIHYFGKDLTRHRSEILSQVSHASAYNKLPNNLTIDECMDMFGRLYGLKKKERLERINFFLERFGMIDLRKQVINTLSSGQMTRIILAKAFLFFPKIVLLDEPTVSLDPEIAKEVREFILQQRQDFDVAMILTSHNMAEVSEMCDRVLVMKEGRIIEEDAPQKLASKTALTKVVLSDVIDLEKALNYLNAQELSYKLANNLLTIEVDEPRIAALLSCFGKMEINYTHISIEKPTLEEYFLHMTRAKRLK